MLITNFYKGEETLYRQAVRIYGDKKLYIDQNAYVNRQKDMSASALRYNGQFKDLTEFWKIFDGLKHEYSIVNKYNIHDRILTRINYINDRREQVEAIIIGIDYNEESKSIRYKIKFEPSDILRKQGCMGSEGYVNEKDIIKLL